MKTNKLQFNLILTISLVMLLFASPAQAANRIFDLHLQNTTGAPVVFNLTPGSCYEGHSPAGARVQGQIRVQAGGYYTFRVARVQGNDCDGEQGYFQIQPNGMQIQKFEFNNSGKLELRNKVFQYIGELSAKRSDESYVWAMKSCPSGGCASQVRNAGPQTRSDNKRYNRIFNLSLQNGFGRTVVFNIIPGSCYEGHNDYGIVQGEKRVQAGGRYTFRVARVQGHGCNGKQGNFTVQTSGQKQTQRFSYDNAGHLGLLNFPDAYNGELSEKSQYDESYTWTVKLPDSRIARSKTVMIRHSVSKLYLIQGYRGNRDDKRNVEVQPIEGGDHNYRWVIQPVGGGWNHLVNAKTGLLLTWDGNDLNVSNWGNTGGVNNQWRFQKASNGYKIINRGNNRELEQAYHGTRDDKRNVTTDGGGIWTFETGPMTDLAKVTIISVKAIKASSGQDQGTKFLFQGIQMAAEMAASGGSSWVASKMAQTAGKEIAKKVIKESLKQQLKNKTKEVMSKKFLIQKMKDQLTKKALAKKAAKKVGLEAANRFSGSSADSALELAFNEIYGESPDQLNIKVNGVSIWPNGGRDWRNIKSQQTLPVNTPYIFERRRGFSIQLLEYDSGSGDDSLGWISMDTQDIISPETFEEVLVINESEKSVYLVTFKVETLEPTRYKTTKVAAKPAQMAVGCRGYGKLRSPASGSTPVSVQFTNKTRAKRSVNWLDFNGKSVRYKDLRPNESFSMNTGTGHPWMILDGQGNCTEIFVPKASSKQFNIAAASSAIPSQAKVVPSQGASVEVRNFKLINDLSIPVFTTWIDGQGKHVSTGGGWIQPGGSFRIENGGKSWQSHWFAINTKAGFMCSFSPRERAVTKISQLSYCRP